eukprot:1195703-Prorocentrum_minimum.AAC.2
MPTRQLVVEPPRPPGLPKACDPTPTKGPIPRARPPNNPIPQRPQQRAPFMPALDVHPEGSSASPAHRGGYIHATHNPRANIYGRPLHIT